VVEKRERHMGPLLAIHPRVFRICVWATYSFVMYFIWLFASWIVQGYGVVAGLIIIVGTIAAAYVWERR
jgi:hypothetical protein